MRHRDIPPFYFPTTVAFVDDSADFLANLSLQLDGDLAFKLYDSPLEALVALNGINNQPPPSEKFFALYRNGEESPFFHHIIGLNLDKVHREVHNEFRFEEVSVAVVDYDMPEINGLEFCRNVKSPAVKKILLTGKADEKIAVQAFNQGLIDCFIPKHDAAVIETLNRAIAELQLAYFYEIEKMLADALAVGSSDFLRDPAFAEAFREICRERRTVEYYLCSNPEGILMLDADAVPSLLIVQTEQDLFSHFEIAYDQAAPQDLLDALKSNQVVPYFWQSGGHYKPECADWQSCLLPATELKGRQWYYYSVVRNPPGFKLNSVVSYNEFLAQLDQQGRSNTNVRPPAFPR